MLDSKSNYIPGADDYVYDNQKEKKSSCDPDFKMELVRWHLFFLMDCSKFQVIEISSLEEKGLADQQSLTFYCVLQQCA